MLIKIKSPLPPKHTNQRIEGPEKHPQCRSPEFWFYDITYKECMYLNHVKKRRKKELNKPFTTTTLTNRNTYAT